MNKLLRFSLLLLLAFGARTFALDVEKLKPSVVRLVVFAEDPKKNCTGSGFVIESSATGSHIATNYHVIAHREKDNSILIARRNGKEIEAFEGTLVLADAERDLAIVRAPKLQAEPCVLQEALPAQGDDVFSLGFPGVSDDPHCLDLKFFIDACYKAASSHINDPTGKVATYVEASLSKATVRRVVKGKWSPNDACADFMIIEHDVNITGGNSGGPLLNAAGNVVGINTQRVPDANIPIDIVRRSSHIGILIEAMKIQGLRPTTTSAPAVIAVQTLREGATTFLMAFVAIAAVGVALFFGLRRPTLIAETYTHFLRRGAATPAGPPPRHPGQGNPQPLPPAPSSGGWILEGVNPQAGQSASFRFDITPALLACAHGKLIVGRKQGLVHILIPNTSISGQHAAFLVGPSGLSLEDRNSSNGTQVNGRPLKPFESCPLKSGDQIIFGELKIQLRQK